MHLKKKAWNSRVEQLEMKLLQVGISKNNHSQYKRDNNLEMQGIENAV